MTKEQLKEKILSSNIQDNFFYIQDIKSIIFSNDEPTKENIEILKELLLNDMEVYKEMKLRNILFIIGYTNVIFTPLIKHTYSFYSLHLIDLASHEESIHNEYDCTFGAEEDDDDDD